MGFLSDLFGGGGSKQSQSGSSSTSASTTQSSKKQGTSSTVTGTTGAQTGASKSEQQQTQQLLAPEVQELLIGVIGNIAAAGGAGGATGDEAQTVAQQLLARAGGTQDFVDQRTGDIVKAARVAGQQEVDAIKTRNTRQAGSSFNTLAQQASTKAQQDFELQLAGLAAEIGLAGREQETGALAQGFDALVQSGQLGASAGLEDARVIGDLVNVLKGATATSTGVVDTSTQQQTEQQSTENTVQELIEAIQQVTKSKTKTSGTAKVSSTPSVLDVITSLGGLVK